MTLEAALVAKLGKAYASMDSFLSVGSSPGGDMRFFSEFMGTRVYELID